MYVHKLDKRDVFEGADAARWAFFGLFILAILLVIVGTMRVNKKRNTNGLQPIFGTRWMTPPSYLQSQTQYDQPTGRNYTSDQPANYVPTYTETANDQDLGYYDQNGQFHENPNAKPGYRFDSENSIINNPAHQRSGSRDGVVVGEIGHDEDLDNFTRPSYRPQDSQSAASPTTTAATTARTTASSSTMLQEGSSQVGDSSSSQLRGEGAANR